MYLANLINYLINRRVNDQVQMINKPSVRPNFKNDDLTYYDETINKALQIQSILMTNQTIDKQISKKGVSYMIEYINILNLLDLEDKNYSDEIIAKKINHLYDKIFKNRRY